MVSYCRFSHNPPRENTDLADLQFLQNPLSLDIKTVAKTELSFLVTKNYFDAEVIATENFTI